MRKVYILALVALGWASCTGSNKVAKDDNGNNVTNRTKAACGNLHVDMDKPHIDWFETDKSVLSKSSEILVLPKEYKVYSVDTAQLNNFFAAIEKGQTVVSAFPLPKPAECQLFTLKAPKNKTPGLDMPGAVTAQGECKGQKMNLTYHNGKAGAYVNWFDIKYRISTILIEGLPYLIIYEQQTPPPIQNGNKTSSPKIMQIRYDK